VKYLRCKCEGRISFDIERSEIFHNFRKEIISHSASAEYFTSFPPGLEKHRKLCYNEIRKAVGSMYSGIEINEGKLLANNIVFTLILLFIIAIGVFAFFVYRNRENKNTKDRIKHLEAKAKTDPIAQKQLERLNRKRNKRKKDGILDKALTFSLLLVLFSITLFVAVIPGWTDYVKKDYVVYGGDLSVEYEVHRYIRSSTITLKDGTVLTGAFGLDEGKHTEVIVYSRRTKIVIGINQ
jgi:hypothetical protein